MSTFSFLVLAGAVMAAGVPVVLGKAAGHRLHAAPEFVEWSQIDAEVISCLRVHDHIFLRVRFAVGTSIIQTDVEFPSNQPIPHTGRRIPISYDPTAPARASFDG